MPLPLSTRRNLVYTGTMIVSWCVACMVSASLFVLPDLDRLQAVATSLPIPSLDPGWLLARELVAGVSAGLLASTVELWLLLPRQARRYRAGIMLVVRTSVYALIAALAVAVTVNFVIFLKLGMHPRPCVST